MVTLMRIDRRARDLAAGWAAACFLLTAGCATTAGTRPAANPAPAAQTQAGGTATGSGAGAGAIGDPGATSPTSAVTIAGEEEAERARVELDNLTSDSPRWRQLRQGLLQFYVSTATALLERGQADDAYGLFTSALSLYEARELQGAMPSDARALLPLAEQIDRRFSRRGSHPQVVTALMVQLTMRPTDETLRLRYGQIRTWLDGQDDGMRNLMRGRSGSLPELLASPPPTLESDLEQTYRAWPARVVRDELLPLYRGEALALSGGSKRSPKDFLQSLSANLRRKGLTNSPAYKIGRAFLRASLAKEAVAAIKQLGQEVRLSGEEARLVDSIEASFLAPASGTDDEERMMPAVKLAASLAQNPEDAEVSLQICRDVAARAPKLVPAHLCVGELAVSLDRKGLALRAFEQARQLAPRERPVWEMVGRLYLERLGDLLVEERTAELESALSKIEAFYQSMRQQFPDQPPTTGMAVALAEVGRGYYNAGRLADAVRYLERSVGVEPNALALEQLGVIQLRRGEGAQAAATLERARAVFQANTHVDAANKQLFGARLGRLIAEALELTPDGKAKAREVRERSLRQFANLLDSSALNGGRAAEAEVERGKLYYQQGEREQGLEAFRRAADISRGDGESKAPGQVFIDVLAFLVPRGELDEAVSMYHRALSVRLPENMKVYCSMWVNDLLQRAGQGADPLAQAFLDSVTGGKWHADLARWVMGKSDEVALMKSADTTGKQAEAQFYVGLSKLRAGDRAAALTRFRKVVESQMLGYFEYEMAREYLRLEGAPTSPQMPKKAAPRPRTAAPPPGSI